MKRKVSIVLVLMLMFGLMLIPHKIITADASFESNVNYKSAVLIEKNSNEILFENNCHERLPIASVTKLMTILLTMEKIGSNEISLDDKVMVSATASGMGGSQVFLDYEEEYYLKDLLKSVIIASANDSSVAIAEHIAGSENNFVKMMNERAKELNLLDTNYVNCTGLPSPDGYSSAYDQAIVLKHVLDFDLYHEYSSIWMEDFVHPSGRTTQMANTNKLSRFYEGCMGGKTGSTNQAKYCLAVGASRNDVELISVVLGAEDSKGRFKLSSDLLNYGFENFETKTLFDNSMLKDKMVKIKGLDRVTHLKAERDFTYVCKIGEDVNFSLNYNLPNMLTKVYENQVVGNVEIVIDGVVVDKINILSTETHEEVTVWDYIKEITNS